MPKRENRLPAEDAPVAVLAAAAPDAAAAAVLDAAAPDAAAAVAAPDAAAPGLAVLSVPAAQDQAQNELLFKMVVEQQRQQIEALSSMVRELQHRIVAPPPPPLP